MIFNVSILKNEKWFAREQITLQVSFYLGSLLWKNVNRDTTHPTYTLCRLQKTQNLKFLQNLAGFWIFEFSMGISQTWYFNKYIHRINVAFVNRDTQNFQLILFWILCVLFFQNAKFGPTLHFCQNKCMKIVLWWVEKLPSFHPNNNAAFLSRQW